MNFKNFLLIISFFFIVNCADSNISTNNKNIVFKNVFSNKGFALIYNSKHYNNGLVSKKIDERSLTIFQRNLKTNTLVKITNILNNKSLVANVVGDSTYPLFNNSVISKRIAEELNLNMDEPYIEILEISKNSMFIAKKAKTFDEEKNVASKAPIDDIQIKDLSNNKKKKSEVNTKKFSYIIKIADFYFEKSADQMKTRVLTETSIKKVNINKLSRNKFRVYLGPFNNLNSLKKSFNAINVLQFDTIEIIKK